MIYSYVNGGFNDGHCLPMKKSTGSSGLKRGPPDENARKVSILDSSPWTIAVFTEDHDFSAAPGVRVKFNKWS